MNKQKRNRGKPLLFLFIAMVIGAIFGMITISSAARVSFQINGTSFEINDTSGLWINGTTKIYGLAEYNDSTICTPANGLCTSAETDPVWNSEKASYLTIASALASFPTNSVFGSVGNWSADKSSYNTTSELSGLFYSLSNPFGYYNSSTLPVGGNTSWNQTLANALYYPLTTNPLSYRNTTQTVRLQVVSPLDDNSGNGYNIISHTGAYTNGGLVYNNTAVSIVNSSMTVINSSWERTYHLKFYANNVSTNGVAAPIFTQRYSTLRGVGLQVVPSTLGRIEFIIRNDTAIRTTAINNIQHKNVSLVISVFNNGTINVYVDNNLVSSSSGIIYYGTQTESLRFGGNLLISSNQEFFNGTIYEYKEFDVALNHSEVALVYENRSVRPESLVAWYTFTNGTCVTTDGELSCIEPVNTGYQSSAGGWTNTSTVARTPLSVNVSSNVFVPNIPGTGSYVCFNNTNGALYRQTGGCP
jgi:hypothetical protein